MLVLSTDSNKLQEAKRSGSLEDAVRALPDYIKLLLPQQLLNKVHDYTPHVDHERNFYTLRFQLKTLLGIVKFIW